VGRVTKNRVVVMESTDRPAPAASTLSRRTFLRCGAAGSLLAATASACSEAGQTPTAGVETTAVPIPAFELEEATLADLQAGMESGAYTARRLVERYVSRIEALDGRGPTLSHVMELNPDALAIAEALDAERRTNGPRGPLHGIPILIKDNIDTGDRMMTTAGSLALVGAPAPRDAFLVERLRAAGAVVLGKTNLSEWANFRSTRSSSGWSARGGQGRNPYALDRSPCGSSSGTGGAIAANYAAVGIGTETDGSIVCPSGVSGLVGLKPTLGLVSRAGIVPIAHSQDTAGPMTRTVADAAILLGAISGEDPRDPSTAASQGRALTDYTPYLDPNGLRGARIGVPRERFFGYSRETDRIAEAAIDVLEAQGAVVIDPADLPHAGEYDDSEFTVLLYEFKADLNQYLAGRGVAHTLASLIAFNDQNHAREMPYFGQEIFLMAEEKGSLTDPEYLAALAKNHRLSRAEGIDAVMDRHQLDALMAPTGNPAWPIDLVNGDHFLGGSSTPAAVAGYPSITVPGGFSFGLPVGISFFGRPWSEPTLIRIAYAFEQATKHRRPPAFLPRVDLSTR
jgi:amidase